MTVKAKLVLGIETSCDETGVALYDTIEGLKGHKLYSQVKLHARYGGVVPELASRDHIKKLLPLVRGLLKDTKIDINLIDSIAYTKGPGLSGALLVGTTVANALGYSLKKPVIGVHHLEAHLLSPLLSNPNLKFPFVALLVSGGHTQLIQVGGIGQYKLMGETRDDAAGEAFDKTAKLLGLPYPGGALLSELARDGDASKYPLPKPMINSDDLDFSFSGLKTAVAHLVQKLNGPKVRDPKTLKADIAASFQDSVTEVLTEKCYRALRLDGAKSLVIAGGVGANTELRRKINEKANTIGCKAYYPPFEFCTDNGAMVALIGALKINEGIYGANPFDIKPKWPLGA
ncbi:MAG: tRNA (adenosine(37)-N6)-threonylcarbamoyltransferase complex transferase subunit TsaD [Burkholderiales bacterium]